MSTITSDRDYALKPAIATPTINSQPTASELPDKPLVLIQSRKSWSAFDLRELWTHRELLYFLTLRDLKVRYKQTLLGAVWVILQPLLLTLIFTIFLGMITRISAPGLPYPVFVYSGLLPWMFISGGIAGCSTSLAGNSNLLTKVYFPRLLLPAAYLGTRVVDFAISFVILTIILAFYRLVLHSPLTVTPKLVALPAILLLMVLFTFGVGTLTASLNVRYRDVGVALPVLIQLWMFTSPIIYPATQVPEKWRLYYSLNPAFGLIEGFRAALLGLKIPLFALASCTLLTVVILAIAALVFRRTEKGFADVV